MRKKVLVFNEFYLPGVKGGGPIRSIENLVSHLSNEIEFYILTSDRDFGDQKPYEGVILKKWLDVNGAKVLYIDKNEINISFLSTIMKYQKFDYYYLNSFFNYKFSILPLLTKIKNKKQIDGEIIMAPRGEFSPGALNLKKAKKKAYIKLFKKFINYERIIWHATSTQEKEYITSIFNDELRVRVAGNLTKNYKNIRFQKEIKKLKGQVNFVFVSRIHPKKNLLDGIRMLSSIEGDINYNIYGPIEDKNYWEKCKEAILKLPPNIQVNYRGILEHEKIIDVFNDHHFFLFPTLGENFGHVISESLVGACPVIISDQTPWEDLSKLNIGWDIPLENKDKFIEVINYSVNMGNEEYLKMAKKSFNYGLEKSIHSQSINNSLNLFL